MNKQGYYVLWDTDEGLRYYKAIEVSESDKKIKVNYEDNTDSEFFKKDLFTTKTNSLFNVLTSEQWAALTLLDMKGEGSPKREKETLVANTQEGSGRKRNLKTRKLKGRGGKKRKRKTKKHRRVKKRRKKTRKKRGRGVGTSKIAKVGVGALAASSVIGQGMGHGISPSRGTPAAVNHFNTVACSDFHIGDIVEHSEDHGQNTDHYRPVLRAALAKKRTCKRRGKPMRNPNTGKPMSKKKQNQSNRRRRARARAKEKEKAKTRSKKSDTKNGRQGKKAKNKGSNLTPGDYAAAGVGLAGTAAMVLGDRQRGRRRDRNRNRPPRAPTPPRQRYG